ncbi:ribosome biogenesis protein NOP53 isoform X2 [Conger conger]|uniref:ribosome biogenesis protein NOP53 isoform X2 n=1 Tax=Conger conger TaxID=82655 RepID=UPI002A5A9EC8|nr:ribosome biogenesis protein NOP53 isoform X2 [Conger conger]
MAAARRNKRVAATQPGFLKLNSSLDHSESNIRRKRVNKNKKKNWNKHSDIQDVEEFLDDVRLQERSTGGLISEKSDDNLFFVDTGEHAKNIQKEGAEKTGRGSRPLRIDLILQHDSLVPPPKDVLAHQLPNAKKLRRIAQRAEQLAAKGVLPRRQKLLLRRKVAAGSKAKERPPANNHPERPFYDLWGEQSEVTADPYYLEQTKKKLVKRPDKLNQKPSELPAVEVIAPGGSYNPEFFSHQALLLQAHEVEVKKQKEEQRVERQLAVRREDKATEETVFQEQVEGLLEEEEEEEPMKEGEESAQGKPVRQKRASREKKTEKQRKRAKTEKEKEQQRRAEQVVTGRKQQLFQLRSIRAELKRREQRTRERQTQRHARKEAQKSLPRRLGRLKFQAPDLEVQLSDEIPGSLRLLRPEGSILKDRFKSLQKRNMIEPRERAKFKRRHKLKYVEKRAFKAIT